MLYICSDRTRHASRWPANQGGTFLIKGNHCNIQMRYEEFEDAFSSDRMSKYVTACNGDTRRSKKQKYIVKYLQDLDIMPKFAAFIPGSLWISSCRVFLFIAIWWKTTSNVIFEFPSPDKKFFDALAEARRKYSGRMFFYIIEENILKEVKKQDTHRCPVGGTRSLALSLHIAVHCKDMNIFQIQAIWTKFSHF